VKKEDEFKSFGGNNKKKGDFVYLRRRNQNAVSPKISIPSGIAVCEKSLKKLTIKTFPLKDKCNETVQANGEIKGELHNQKRKRKACKGATRSSLNINTSYTDLVIDDSSDENSSKSALDWLVPPPSNFHGINNPFHSQYKTNAKITELMAKKGFNAKMFEKLPETRIVRTIKRRLSAKEIALGSNRDSKRRKIMKRRKTDEVEIISEIIQPLTMPLPSYIPVRDSRDFYKTDNHCEPLKAQKQPRDVNVVKPNSVIDKQSTVNISLTDTVMNSPIKNKSINLYFGALNRIENGEHFTILAKRWTGGKEEFLLEWDNPTFPIAKNEN
jgi:Polycomb-like MTF2 factor 2